MKPTSKKNTPSECSLSASVIVGDKPFPVGIALIPLASNVFLKPLFAQRLNIETAGIAWAVLRNGEGSTQEDCHREGS